jgi:CxxC-x17-CxxC domain-containing protein
LSQKMKFEIECTECGNSATVPFKPTAGKPVYCKSCYSKRKRKPQNEVGLTKRFNMKNAWAIRGDDWQGRREKSHNIFSRTH